MKTSLYKNPSRKNVLDKSSSLDEIATLDGTFRNAQSILSPTITIDLKDYYFLTDDDSKLVMDDDSVLTTGYFVSDLLLKANYAYIDELERYYYVTDIQVVSSNIINISLKVDPLMSFKDDILSNYCCIARNYTNKNLLLEDNQTRFKYDSKIEFINPTNVGDVSRLYPDAPSVIFTYLTEDALNNPQTVQEIDGLPEIASVDAGLNLNNTQYYRILTTDIISIAKAVYVDDTAKTYLKGLYLFPFDVDISSAGYLPREVKFGTKTTINFNGAQLYYNPYRIIIADFNVDEASSYLDYSPYSTYKIYVPYYGEVELTGEQILGKRIKVFYCCSFDDGSTTAYIYNQTDEKILFSSRCYMSTSISLSTTNATELDNSKNALALNTAVSAISSSIALGVGVATMNPVAIVGGGMGLVKTATSAITKSNNMMEKASAVASSMTDGLNNKQEVYIKKITQQPIEDIQYRLMVGYPLNESKKLSSLVGSGFTVVDDSSHLMNLESATKTEYDEIENLVHSGIIL